MKFSELDRERWGELQPYLDTCLLPITGLSGSETPWQATAALERLRDALDLIEIPFKGRVVTYPACHYVDRENGRDNVNRLAFRLKEDAGFRHVILIACKGWLEKAWHCPEADLFFVVDTDPNEIEKERKRVSEELTALWAQTRGRGLSDGTD